MKNPRLTSSLASRLKDGLQSLPLLEEVVITKPTVVNMFPHLTSIRRLKLVDLPRNCDDWDWLEFLGHLEDVEVSTSSPSRKLTNEERPDTSSLTYNHEGFRVRADQAEIWSATKWTLRAFEKLPTSVRGKVWNLWQLYVAIL